MESKRLLSPVSGLDSPPRPQAFETNANSDQRNHAPPSGRRVFEDFDNQNSASAKSKYPLSKKASPYTDKFFANVAEAIVRSFPFTEFAKENGCDIKDVVRAIKAAVVEPLSKPSIQKSSTPRECTPLIPATLASTLLIAPSPVASQSKHRIAPRQPGKATMPPAPSWSTGLSPSTGQLGESQEGEAAKCVQNDAELVSSAAATFKPFKPFTFPEGGRRTKRRKTMAPAERQFVKQDVYGNYVPANSQTTASVRLGDNGSKGR
ncbi:hypothetical protein BDV10DRAFT_68065 [Aspergillus recurvatus]